MEKIRKVRLMVLFGLILGLIGAFSDARPAFAQEKKITAREVVDRKTLKVFVRAAAKAFRDSMMSTGYGEVA